MFIWLLGDDDDHFQIQDIVSCVEGNDTISLCILESEHSTSPYGGTGCRGKSTER